MKKLPLALYLLMNSFIGYSQIIETEVKLSVPLRDSGDAIYKILPDRIEKGENVELLDFNNDFWLVSNGITQGWLPTAALYRTEAMRTYLLDFKLKSLIKNYGEKDGTKIYNGGTWIGMGRNMLYDAKGLPEKINKITSNLSKYQLIYKNEYYYLQDELVIDIQKF